MNDQWKTKLTLIERAKAEPEDIDTWDEFIKFYEPFIIMLLNKHKINISNRDDLCQIILLKIWKFISSYTKEKARFRTWLSTLIRNEIVTYINKANKDRQREFEYDKLDTNNKTKLEESIESEWQEHLTNLAFERLEKKFSENSMKVFTMSLEGYNTEDIAKKLELNKESVFVLRSKVKTAFKKEVENIRRHIEL
ncbi:probable RNA polymerase sigma-H factor [Lentisphaera araneosa HTCC2155]|jgi:RNA polymerase sigma factor (sigma-70 family)|uniref:Probable RNA polymerase sigma-H factor n=1 Tax=Lentisphaera araneosa HTCC2155 TaxID=313628 RepID=A6DIG8_9BACT|nr:sigma-70 family RNA polymerase sigma factor [Lentisphaera araneosa]EDM28822.1 probable RNA polymerase sigma-H factor [Lentisphaera araneosa HTCC2155]